MIILSCEFAKMETMISTAFSIMFTIVLLQDDMITLRGVPVEGASLNPFNRTNWAGNIVYGTDRLLEAESVEGIQSVVRSEAKVTVLGTAHCFNAIADNTHAQLSVLPMRGDFVLDAMACTVTVAAGTKYAQLCPFLDAHGLALHNLASLSDISIAGAISTATHGSGERNGNLATAIAALELVTADGELVKLSPDSHGYHGAVVGLGALGVIARVTLKLQPAFTVRQYVYENLPLAEMVEHFDEIMASGYSVSLFTDWQEKRIKQVWIKVREGYGVPFAAPEVYFGATLATKNLHPVGLSAENCTQQMGVPGPWYDRLPHFRAGVTPSVGKELQSEYFVGRRHAVAAILALESTLRDEIGPHLFISEIRTIAEDELWMSTAYRRASVAIHFTWKQEWEAVRLLLPLIERALAPFRPRPHWGKLFTMPPAELQSRYEMVDEFRRLAAKLDPSGKFRNEFLTKNIFTNNSLS